MANTEMDEHGCVQSNSKGTVVSVLCDFIH